MRWRSGKLNPDDKSTVVAASPMVARDVGCSDARNQWVPFRLWRRSKSLWKFGPRDGGVLDYALILVAGKFGALDGRTMGVVCSLVEGKSL